MPQLGAVLVPINYRLIADDFAYIINHSGARIVCAHPDYLDAVDAIRAAAPGVEHFVALEGAQDGWIDYERALAAAPAEPSRPAIDEHDLLTLNYTSGTTARPKGVMITHRNAYMNIGRDAGPRAHDARRPLPVDAADVPRERLDVHAGPSPRSAARTSACAKVDPAQVFALIKAESDRRCSARRRPC